MSQEALDFGRDHRVSEGQRSVLRVLNDAVDAIGLLVAAGACGCRTQDLSDAHQSISLGSALLGVARHGRSVRGEAWQGCSTLGDMK